MWKSEIMHGSFQDCGAIVVMGGGGGPSLDKGFVVHLKKCTSCEKVSCLEFRPRLEFCKLKSYIYTHTWGITLKMMIVE